MAQRQKTAFELDVESDMQNPQYRAAYKRARAKIEAIDKVVRALDAARQRQAVSKAELARRMGVPAEAVRRLFSTDSPNPTMKTVVGAAQALGLRIKIESRKDRRRSPQTRTPKPRQKTAA
jgi:DNA-binding phage protein